MTRSITLSSSGAVQEEIITITIIMCGGTRCSSLLVNPQPRKSLFISQKILSSYCCGVLK
jgi:hypothetical protein